jgi:hypothetical protein
VRSAPSLDSLALDVTVPAALASVGVDLGSIVGPFRRFEGGTDRAGLGLETVFGRRGEIFPLRDTSMGGVPGESFGDRDLGAKTVHLHTRWSRPFGTGIDTLTIDDDGSGGEWSAHSLLLLARIPVVEHLAELDPLPESGGRDAAVAPKLEGFDSLPAGASARVP